MRLLWSVSLAVVTTGLASAQQLESPNHSPRMPCIVGAVDDITCNNVMIRNTITIGGEAKITSRITVGSGSEQSIFVPTTGQLLDIRSGSIASPDRTTWPVVKVNRIIEQTDNSERGDGGENFAAFVAVAAGTASNKVQPVGVLGGATNRGTDVSGTQARPDAVGVYGYGRIIGSGAGVGMGGFFAGRRDTDTGKALGVEIQSNNKTATVGTYNPSGFSTTAGAWLNANGDEDSGVGIAIANPFGRQYRVGIGFVGQVAGGKTGGVADSSIRDDSHSRVSVNIKGSHIYGVDLKDGTFSVAPIRLPNETFVTSRNAGDTTDISLIGLNSSNIVSVGVGSTSILMSATVAMTDGGNIALGTNIGTRIGTTPVQKIGFYGATPVVKPTVTGSRDSGRALESLLSQLAILGLIVDRTSE